ncbi:hypothetical protein ACLOJK_029165 [Asimina triloba]
MEIISAATVYSSFSITDFIGFLLFQIIHGWFGRCRKFYYRFMSFLRSFLEIFINEPNSHRARISSNSDSDGRMKSMVSKQPGEKGDLRMDREDVQVVMEKLGMHFDREGGGMLKACFGSEELSALFEEKEPSLEEAKEAFSVFDENGDEFIDARELQRVLRKLGFGEASEIDACEKMIRAFDENKDGRIDFNEFLKLIESSFFC